MFKYVAIPRKAWVEEWTGNAQPAQPTITIWEGDPQPAETGLLDSDGTPLYRVMARAPIGFRVR
jgi:hypothetical protein